MWLSSGANNSGKYMSRTIKLTFKNKTNHTVVHFLPPLDFVIEFIVFIRSLASTFIVLQFWYSKKSIPIVYYKFWYFIHHIICKIRVQEVFRMLSAMSRCWSLTRNWLHLMIHTHGRTRHAHFNVPFQSLV